MALNKLACVVLLMFIVMGAPIAQAAITCSQVTSSLSSCIQYVRGSGTVQPACCTGVKNLNSAAKTTPDRQSVCNCLKTLASSIRGVNYGLVAGLPGKCGVSIPYKISPSTDCKKVK